MSFFYTTWLHTRTKFVSGKHLTQAHLKISSRSLENLASHLMTTNILLETYTGRGGGGAG